MTTPSKIETERLTLRRLRPADASALSAMHAHPDVNAWLARGPMSVDEASDVIARFEAHFDAYGFGALPEGHALRRHVVYVARAGGDAGA